MKEQLFLVLLHYILSGLMITGAYRAGERVRRKCLGSIDVHKLSLYHSSIATLVL